MSDRYGTCDPGFCCVRDQFLASYVYCKRIPTDTHHCITVHSESECACASGLTCRPNINVPTYTSVYGTCKADVDENFPPSTPPTSTQHKHTHAQHQLTLGFFDYGKNFVGLLVIKWRQPKRCLVCCLKLKQRLFITAIKSVSLLKDRSEDREDRQTSLPMLPDDVTILNKSKLAVMCICVSLGKVYTMLIIRKIYNLGAC